MTTCAYIRVSKLDQDTEKNKLDILKFANERKLGNVEFTEEHVTGKKHFKDRKLGLLCNTQKIDNQIDLFKDKLNLISMSDKEFIDEGKSIIECSRKAFELYQKQTTEEKRRLLDVMFEQIKLKGRNIEYTYKKPFCYFAKCNLENVDEIVNFINSHIKK